MGFPKIGTLNSRSLIIRTPKEGTPNFRKLPLKGLWSLWETLEI